MRSTDKVAATVSETRYQFVPTGDGPDLRREELKPGTEQELPSPDRPIDPSAPSAQPQVPPVSDSAGAVGHFRVYLAAVAGAGKTVAMLDEGQRRRALGADVVI